MKDRKSTHIHTNSLIKKEHTKNHSSRTVLKEYHTNKSTITTSSTFDDDDGGKAMTKTITNVLNATAGLLFLFKQKEGMGVVVLYKMLKNDDVTEIVLKKTFSKQTRKKQNTTNRNIIKKLKKNVFSGWLVYSRDCTGDEDDNKEYDDNDDMRTKQFRRFNAASVTKRLTVKHELVKSKRHSKKHHNITFSPSLSYRTLFSSSLADTHQGTQ